MVLVRILWLSVAVYFISELTKFELIITIFEHNYVYLSPTLRINVFILNAMLDIVPLYSTSCYTTTMGVASGSLGPWSPNYVISIVCPHFANFTKRS